MSSTFISGTNKEYRWQENGADGLRSYSYNFSNPNWNYTEITNPDKSENEAYTFTDSSTGQPFARRGNLYNLTAATLGSSLELTTSGQQAPDSICPRGWQLPVTTPNTTSSVPANDMANRSFARLLRTYDLTQLGGSVDVDNYNRLVSWPLQYLPTGNYNYSNGSVIYRTASGYWWSGVVSSATNGCFLDSWTEAIYVQGNHSRGRGFARRWVEFLFTLGIFLTLC